MRYNVMSIFLVLNMVCVYHVFGAQLLDPTKLFSVMGNEKEEQITHVKDELTKIKASMKERLARVQNVLTQVNTLSAEVKTQLQEAPATQQEFLTKKASLLNELNQTLFNIQFQCKEIPLIVEQRIKLLEEVIKDPTHKDLILESRSFYSYEVFQREIKRVFDQEDAIKTLITQKNDETIELENRKKKLESALKNYRDKKREQETFAAKISIQEKPGQLGFKHQGELLDLEEKRALYEQELAELRVQAASKKIELINTGITIEQEKLAILKNNLTRAKGLRIAESEVKEAQDSLEKIKQKSLASKELLYEEIKKIAAERDILKQELAAIIKRYKLSASAQEKFVTWSVETPTVESYSALSEVGYKSEYIDFLDRKIEFLRAEIQREDVKFRREEIKTFSLETWFNLTQPRRIEGEGLLQGLKKFKELDIEIHRELSSSQDRRNAATNLLNMQNKDLLNIRKIIQDIEKEKEGLFKRYPLRYNAILVYGAETEKILGEHIDVLGKLLEVYSEIISTLNGTVKEIGIVIAELETQSIWQRSRYAISWQGIKNIIPDLGRFIDDVRFIGSAYFSIMTWSLAAQTVTDVLQTPGQFLFILLFILLVISLYIFLRIRLPIIRERLLQATPQGRFLAIFIKSLGCFCDFFEHYLVGMYSWLVVGTAFYLDIISNLFLQLLFYLISIPYLIYYIRKLVTFFSSCVKQYQTLFFAELFERRFSLIFSVIAYMTVFVGFLREAFLLVTVYKSELPTILFAAYSIVIRTLIIFTIGKDEILALLPKRGAFWIGLSWVVEHYYYPLLMVIIALMIVSDPFVGGYGNLISYILWGLIGSIILARALYLLHSYTKKYSEYIFFSTDEEIKRERFSYGKTWYGIFVISIFLLFIILGIAVGTKIWGIPIAWENIWNILDFKLFNTGIIEHGEPIWFTPRTLFALLALIFSAFLLATAFSSFVLQRIFDLFFVDLGIQNTIITITRYLIIVIVIFIGFQWANLNSLLIGLGVIIGLIGYNLKESIGDFISYFIILVQRPIQIGDYIMLSDQIAGVVRKITPRSVLLRRKDSYTIIVPNSLFLTQPINNWNYAKNFIAFDDIYVTVAYSANPVQVKRIIEQILDENIDVLKNPRPVIRLQEFGQYGFVFMIRGFLSNKNVLNQWDIASNIRFAIADALVQHGIQIATSTRIVLHQDDRNQNK